MLQDINKHIALVNDALAWAKTFGKDAFPTATFKEYRRKLRKIYTALEENCSAAAYGESQVGKSYLMSSLLSSSDSPFVIQSGRRGYSFIDDLNPSGGNNSKVESTGVITRFTLAKNETPTDRIKIRLLSVVDIILLITDSYYNDLKLDTDNILRYDEVNKALEDLSHLWANHTEQHQYVSEDDIRDIEDYIKEVIGNNASNTLHSHFFKTVAPNIAYVPCERWVEVFSLLWNRNEEMNRLFVTLIEAYKQLRFTSEVYVPFTAVLREKGTLLKIEWLDTVCGVDIEVPQGEELHTQVYDNLGQLLAPNFHKGHLSALIAELTFELPQSVARERQFLNDIDLLDFPGARSREKYKESEISTVLPKILRRGKVAYLFNKYSRSLRISSVLFCHHNDQKTEPTIGDTINSWIEDNIGHTPQERAEMLMNTNRISPLFMVATKFNIDLEITKTDSPSHPEKLDSHWNRFGTVIPEIIKPYKWMDEWVPQGGAFSAPTFQNVYPLRDFYWSGKNHLFTGYSDGEYPSPETGVYQHPDFPNYLNALRDSFLRNDFVNKHFAHPEQTWEDVATINNDGSKAIIRDLDSISGVLHNARRTKYLAELQAVKKEMYEKLCIYFEPEDSEERNQRVKQISGDIRRSLLFTIGAKPEIFGQIIDGLMIPVGDFRSIAYDIIICHTKVPEDFSNVNFIRAHVGINPSDSRESNLQKLFDYFGRTTEADLETDFKAQGCTLDAVLSSESETLTTVADVVTKDIIDHWIDFLSTQAKHLESLLPHAQEVVIMLIGLMKKLGIKRIISEKIHTYCALFSTNEQLNAIADFAALTLNNFVSSVGRNYINDSEIENIQAKAQKCGLQIDTSPESWNVVRKPTPLLETLRALDEATTVVNQQHINMNVLRKLPLWDNFQRWQNLVIVGLIYASDISQVDPKANEQIKAIIDNCNTLYN